MRKYGKWIGGGLGWVLGGPIGAIIGYALGSYLEDANSPVQTGKMGTQAGDFTVSLLVLSAAVVRADGRVDARELNYVRDFLLRQTGPRGIDQKMDALKRLTGQNIDLEPVCKQIATHMDEASRLQLLHLLFGISQCDGQVHPLEVTVIGQISAMLGIAHADFEAIKAMFFKDPAADYKILEIAPTASDDEVKKAYRAMAKKFHPDKVSHLGPEHQEPAKQKFQKVQEAYESIKRQRGL